MSDGPPFVWLTFHRSRQPMAVLDTDRVFVAVNDAFTAAFGYGRDWVLGRRVDTVVAPDERAQMRRSWETMLDEGRVDYVRDVVRADGEHMRVRGACECGVVAGRSLVLTVALAVELADWNLSPREVEVIGHVAAGKRASQIAAELHLATSTVQTHLRNAMVKLRARSQSHLVALALTRGEPNPQLRD